MGETLTEKEFVLREAVLAAYRRATPSPPFREREQREGAIGSRSESFCSRPFSAKKGLNSQTGFSLMEVLVGVMILGIVYATLFGLMSGSLKNVGRIEEREKVVRYGQMKLNELVIRARQGDLRQVLSGRFDDRYSWQARLEPFDTGEETPKSSPYFLARVRLSVLWSATSRSNHFDLETLTWVPKPRPSV